MSVFDLIINGPPGSGKSTLLKKVIEDKKNYKHVFWIDSETTCIQELSQYIVAEELNLTFDPKTEQYILSSNILWNTVLNYLNELRDSLVVFFNVNRRERFQELHDLCSSNKKYKFVHYVVLTTLNSVPKCCDNVFLMQPLDNKYAIKLMHSELGTEDDSSVRNIVEMVMCYPQTLKLCSSYKKRTEDNTSHPGKSVGPLEIQLKELKTTSEMIDLKDILQIISKEIDSNIEYKIANEIFAYLGHLYPKNIPTKIVPYLLTLFQTQEQRESSYESVLLYLESFNLCSFNRKYIQTRRHFFIQKNEEKTEKIKADLLQYFELLREERIKSKKKTNFSKKNLFHILELLLPFEKTPHKYKYMIIFVIQDLIVRNLIDLSTMFIEKAKRILYTSKELNILLEIENVSLKMANRMFNDAATAQNMLKQIMKNSINAPVKYTQIETPPTTSDHILWYEENCKLFEAVFLESDLNFKTHKVDANEKVQQIKLLESKLLAELQSKQKAFELLKADYQKNNTKFDNSNAALFLSSLSIEIGEYKLAEELIINAKNKNWSLGPIIASYHIRKKEISNAIKLIALDQDQCKIIKDFQILSITKYHNLLIEILSLISNNICLPDRLSDIRVVMDAVDKILPTVHPVAIHVLRQFSANETLWDSAKTATLFEELKIFEESISNLSSKNETFSEKLLSSLIIKTRILKALWRNEQALVTCQDLIQKCSSTYDVDHTVTMEITKLNVLILIALHRYTEALEICEASETRNLNSDDIAFFKIRELKAIALNNLGQYETALVICDSILDETTSCNKLVNLIELSILDLKATILQSLGRYIEARFVCEDVIKKRAATNGDQDINTIRSVQLKVKILISLHVYDEALDICRKQLPIVERFGIDHGVTLAFMELKATALCYIGDCKEAYSICQNILENTMSLLRTDTEIILKKTKHDVRNLLRKQRYRESFTTYLSGLKKIANLSCPENKIKLENLVLEEKNHPIDKLCKDIEERNIQVQKVEKSDILVQKNTSDRENFISQKLENSKLEKLKKEIETAISRFKEALDRGLEQLQEYASERRPDHVSTLRYEKLKSNIQLRQGRHREALTICAEVVKTTTFLLGEHHVDTLKSILVKAKILQTQHRYKEALEECQKVIENSSRVLGNDHEVLHLKAHILMGLHRYDEALEICESVLKKEQNLFGDDHVQTFESNYLKAEILLTQCKTSQGKLFHCKAQEALKICEELLMKLSEFHFPAHHVDLLNTKHLKAEILKTMRQYDHAFATCEEVLDKRTIILGSDHIDTLESKDLKARIVYRKRKFKEALDICEYVLKKRLRVIGPDHVDTLQSIDLKVKILARQRQYQKYQKGA